MRRRLDEGVPARDLDVIRAPDFQAEIALAVRPAGGGSEAEIRRLLDPSCAEETVHWGRNYLYRARLRAETGEVPVVVKQFRAFDRRERWRRRRGGGKARRSWQASRGFRAAGLPTPEPLLLVESRRATGADLFVTRWVPDLLEMRYVLRSVHAGTLADDFPDVDLGALIDAFAALARRMHDAGFLHRDLSIGNVVLERGSEPLRLQVLDLNRARLLDDVSIVDRSRDLGRMAFFDPAQQARLLDAYWRPAGRVHRLAFLAAHHGFHGKVRLKNRLRGKPRASKPTVKGHHAHIPDAPEAAGVRDRSVWDALSDQPHQHAGKWEKTRVRLADLPSHVGTAATIARAALPVRRRYRELVDGLHGEPIPFEGLGVAIRPRPGLLDDELAALEDLGVRRVLVRLHPWEEDEPAALALSRELAARGVDLAFALPQVRDLVNDRARWRAAVERRAEEFLPYGSHFQIGQAVNRSKWGIWRFEEYFDLVRDASEILRAKDPDVRILGPAVIDFEVQITAALLHRRPRGVFFDVVSSLLYVDRRGAPENPQLGFDTIGKILLVKAIAETAPSSGDESWITEVNWPLDEGPHSPAGRAVAVSEEAQADYLARFYLLALGTGAVSRVYWWQLVARGYGLVADGGDGWRRRPAFRALATVRRLEGATFLGPLASPEGCRLYRFRSGTDEIVAAWSLGPELRAELPRPADEAWSRDGDPLRPSVDASVVVGPSVTYHRLAGPAGPAEVESDR